MAISQFRSSSSLAWNGFFERYSWYITPANACMLMLTHWNDSVFRYVGCTNTLMHKHIKMWVAFSSSYIYKNTFILKEIGIKLNFFNIHWRGNEKCPNDYHLIVAMEKKSSWISVTMIPIDSNVTTITHTHTHREWTLSFSSYFIRLDSTRFDFCSWKKIFPVDLLRTWIWRFSRKL